MIQLLSVLIKHVSISLHRIKAGDFVKFAEDTGERCEHRTSLGEFVEVAGYDDVGVRVEVEE